jgi:diguanylate cyclase (GGDEF)-like protein
MTQPGSEQDTEYQPSETQRPARLGHWAWDVASGAVTWSDDLYRILDVCADEITPSYEAFYRRLHPAHRARAEALVRATFVDGRPCAFYSPLSASDGPERWIRATCAVDVDAAGAPVRMHGTVQETTDRLDAGASPDEGRAGLHDPLTGLADWQHFAGRAAAALDRAAGNGGWSTALLVVDIDRFHRVNDQFGHETGNLVLVEVANRLGTVFRPWDTVVRHGGTVARLGGDRFMVLCDSVRDPAVAENLCRRVADLLQLPVALDTGAVLLTAGIGVCLAPPGETDVSKLIAQAETALRLAKDRGDGAHVVFAPDLVELDRERDETERALRQALAGGELRLHYQPKVALDTDRIVGAEALLRWQHPQRGMVAPLEFIPLAEETGLIVPIGAWVIEEACRQAARWRRSFPDRPVLQVSVNVSARQFGPGLVEVVAGALSASGAEAQALCVEVTESLLMDDIEGSVAILRELAGLGVALSIDDFGTGYSSLAHLKRFPLHELKIDKSFIDGLGRDADDSAIVAAVIALAHALELSVVAEGVETAEQLQRLRTLGCEQAQGYYFARPGPPCAIDTLLNLGVAHGLGGETAQEASQASRPERILVVDDDAEVRQLALMSLTAVGFEVHEAADGLSALRTAKLVGPDCVLLDLVLPDISGLELCRALRVEPTTAASTLLMLTSSDGAADKVEAFSSGADDYITKPFSPRNLASRVNGAMRRRRGGLRPETRRETNPPDAVPAALPQVSTKHPDPR